MSTPKKYVASCPFCEFDVWMDENVGLEDMVTCSNCGTELTVINLDPPDLDFYWEDEWDDDEGVEEYEDEYAFGANGAEPYDWGDDDVPEGDSYDDIQ